MAKNKYVETFKDSFVIDIQRLLQRIGMENTFDSLNVGDILGIRGDISDFEGQLLFGKFRLVLAWDNQLGGLNEHFNSDEEMSAYIKNNVEKAFYMGVKKYADYIFVLNIATVETYGNFDVTKDKNLIRKQINTFMPVISKFMIDALTDSFSIAENKQIVKQ